MEKQSKVQPTYDPIDAQQARSYDTYNSDHGISLNARYWGSCSIQGDDLKHRARAEWMNGLYTAKRMVLNRELSFDASWDLQV